MPFPDNNSVWKEQHPDEGMLHEWLEEQLDTEAAARVAAHVSTCETCRARVAEAHGLIAASRRILTSLDDVPAGVIPTVSTVARVTKDNNVVSINKSAAEATATSVGAIARGSAPTTRLRAQPASFRWRRWGSIAAVLAIGVTGLFVVSKNGDNVSVLNSAASRPVDSVQLPASVSVTQQPVAPIASSASAAAAAAPTTDSASAPRAKVAGGIARDAAPRDTTVAAKRAATEPPAQVATVADRRDMSRNAAVANGAVAAGMAAAPPVVSSSTSDTLAQRLESERRRAAAAEAVAADPARRARIDPLASSAQAFGSAEKARATIGAPRNAPRATSTASGVGGASAPAAPVPAPPRAFSIAAFDSLVLSREPCFGRCPAYELRVSGVGSVHYRSQHPDDNGRTYTAQLPDSTVARLHGLIERARVDTLKSYMPGSPLCQNVRTDSPTLHLSVFRAGRVFKVDQYTGCSEATPAVPTLIREIDTIVGTQRWLPTGYRLP